MEWFSDIWPVGCWPEVSNQPTVCWEMIAYFMRILLKCLRYILQRIVFWHQLYRRKRAEFLHDMMYLNNTFWEKSENWVLKAHIILVRISVVRIRVLYGFRVHECVRYILQRIVFWHQLYRRKRAEFLHDMMYLNNTFWEKSENWVLKAHIILVRISVVRIRVLYGFRVHEVHSHKKVQ